MEDYEFCTYMRISPFIIIVIGILLLVCSILNVANFAQWKGQNATVTLLFAVSILEVIRELLTITSSFIIGMRVLFWLDVAFDAACIWTVVLLCIFRYSIVRLGWQAAEQPGSTWSVLRARIGIGIITGVAVVAYVVPLVIFVIVHGAYGTIRKYETLLNVVHTALPGLVLIGMAVALFVARRRASHRVDGEMAAAGKMADESTLLTGEPARSWELEEQLTTAVLVVAVVLGVVRFPIGIISSVGQVVWQCDLQKAVQILKLIEFISDVTPFVTYVCVLSEYRAVFRRCCRRR